MLYANRPEDFLKRNGGRYWNRVTSFQHSSRWYLNLFKYQPTNRFLERKLGGQAFGPKAPEMRNNSPNSSVQSRVRESVRLKERFKNTEALNKEVRQCSRADRVRCCYAAAKNLRTGGSWFIKKI